MEPRVSDDREQAQAYRRARKRVAARLGFFMHLGAYVLVNAVLIAVNLTRSPQVYWFVWPLAGWGIGLGFHALGVFVLSEDSGLMHRLVERELRRQSRRP